MKPAPRGWERIWSSVVAMLVFAAVSFGPASAFAADRVEALAERLRNHADFRVRTQAALALGATRDARAVSPLCTGLDDTNATVRAAAAAAVGKLQRGGADCLKRRLAVEQNASVKSVLQNAIDRLEGGATPAIGEGTRYYVAINSTTNNTSRSQAAIDRVVRAALAKAMREEGGFAVAPAGETPTAAREVLAKHKGLRPFFVWPKVTASYGGGSLTLDFALSMFTYPGKALIGTTSKKLTMPGVSSPSASDEDELIGMAAERLVPTVARTADKI